MFSSTNAIQTAADQVRSAAVALAALQAELAAATTWSGPDADRFQRNWHEQVTNPLTFAAATLDAVVFVKFTPDELIT